ncbi:MAG: adenosylcobinamide-GDP ribazoletransferase [Candidatus Binatus sp.]|uniref:adenosylcobinamide-GDP ribazoletransferase n=1 Tax=Candidatus Binatus sp. TaxID=2811406 RepID=UPI00271EEB57|nr:adenosylcobinamide-GDP ribazoletransferase [Candidatus Binatus sp.]MDO8434066.1 adenosylcobinamide-GDP ribazoletransferase [Candidatus Binatus sp.]
METEPESNPPGLRDLIFEGVLATATLTLWPIVDERSQGSAEQRSRATIYFPLIGLMLGLVLTIVDKVGGLAFGLLGRSIFTLLIGAGISLGLTNRGIADLVEGLRFGERPASTGLARIGPLGALASVLAFGFEVFCLSRVVDPAGRAAALVMAMMLSRWSIVPIAYGLKPLEQWGLGIPFAGGIRFREFAVSSAIALGLAMGLYQNVGLALIIAVALTILAMRLLLSRRMRGVAGYALAGGCALVEVVTFAVLAALRI